VGKKSKLILKDQIPDYQAEAYTLHNLAPSTAYKVMVALVFRVKRERKN
jgi:hypothetical protein